MRKDLGNTRAHQFYQEAITLGTNSMTTLKTKIKSAINADQSKAWLPYQGDPSLPIQKSPISHGAAPFITLDTSCFGVRRCRTNTASCTIKTMLDQGRYTWRHPFFASIFIYQVDRSVDTIEVLVTSARPDLVIHYSDANVIKIIELTVPFETNIEKEHTFKTNKYATLIQDIKDKQISSELTCVEVGCRGYVSESNKIRITTILKSLDIKPSKRQVLPYIAHIPLCQS